MHQTHLGQSTPVPMMGYPDCGAGLYSRKLGYKEWFIFNCAQRVHQNNTEHLSWTLPLFLANGLFFPRTTAFMAAIVLGGRELYRAGYMSPEGPTSKVREYGAYPLNITELLLTVSVLAIVTRYQFGGFVSRRKIVQRFTQSKFDIELKRQVEELKRKQG